MADAFDHLNLNRWRGSRTRARRSTSGSGQRGRVGLLAALLPLLVTLGLSLAPVQNVQAAPANQQSYNYSKPAGISVEQAAAMVRRETGGRVLSANPTKSNGQRGYNVRVLVDGKRIKQYYVDDQGRMSPK